MKTFYTLLCLLLDCLNLNLKISPNINSVNNGQITQNNQTFISSYVIPKIEAKSIKSWTQ